jgi:hypothetical protein
MWLWGGARTGNVVVGRWCEGECEGGGWPGSGSAVRVVVGLSG